MVSRGKTLFLLASYMLVYAAFASADSPNVSGWNGTAYHTNGWFAYKMKFYAESGDMKFDNGDTFLLSPRYDGAVRKIILSANCSSDNPTRILTVFPFVNGVETGSALQVTNGLAGADGYFIYSFDFSSSSGVDAFRLATPSGSSGIWSIGEVCVFYGEKTADEDAKLKDFAEMLPAPENLHVADFTSESLALAADAVDGATGYRFIIDRLTGTPRTEFREDFIGGTNLVAGWTFGEVVNADLKAATSSYYDNKTNSEADNAAGGGALKIDDVSGSEDVRVEIVSKTFAASVREVSYITKRSSGDSSDEVTVYGTADAGASWQQLGESKDVSTTMKWTTNAVDEALGIKAVKLVFTATNGTFRPCGIDTLRVVYGGDELRVAVGDITNDTAACSLSDLETGRYAYRVQAIGGAELRDSSWTEEQTVDLDWVNLSVSEPQNVQFGSKDGMPTVSWDAVSGADHYLVDVLTVGSPAETVISGKRASATFITLDEIPSVGEYVVRVTAVAPGGKNTAASDDVYISVVLGAVKSVTATATDADTIAASWPAVPLAESYRVRLIRFGGTATTISTSMSALGEGWPAGWDHHAEWTSPTLVSGALKFANKNLWFVPAAYTDNVTVIRCSVKSGSETPAVLEKQRLRIDVSSYESGDDSWRTLTNIQPTTLVSQETMEIPYADGVRRIRFLADSLSDITQPNIQISKFSVTCGERTRETVKTKNVTGTSEVFSGLLPDGWYAVEVMPLPGEDTTLAAESEMVDMSLMQPRVVEPVSFRRLRTDDYTEDFSSLSSIKAAIDVRAITLPHWQFISGGEEQSKLPYSKTGSSTSAGVFVISDTNSTEASYMLATHATGTSGDIITGFSVTNDDSFTAVSMTLSFDAVQRSFQKNAKSQVGEWMVTSNGNASVSAEGAWNVIELSGETAPITTATREDGVDEYRQRFSVELGGAVVAPGEVLIVRWRDEARTSSPMMGIDNVRLQFQRRYNDGYMLMVR